MNPDRPALSVIVPVFNGAATLPDALASLLSQDVAGLEIIVVDDGSTDDGARVAHAFGPLVRCVTQANQGPAAARNHGLRLARGGLVSFLDADDRWPAGRARHHLDLLARHPEAEIVIGPTLMLAPSSAGDRTAAPLLPAPMIQHQLGSATYRKTVFERLGDFDASLRLGEDLDWFRRALAAGVPIRMTAAVALEYQVRPGSLSHGHVDHRHAFLAALQAHLRGRRREAAPAPDSTGP